MIDASHDIIDFWQLLDGACRWLRREYLLKTAGASRAVRKMEKPDATARTPAWNSGATPENIAVPLMPSLYSGGGVVTKIRIELPDATAEAAREAGLLTPQALDRLLTDAIRRRNAAGSLLEIADRVTDAGCEPMSMEEVDAEVKAVRAERMEANRRRRAGGH